MLRAGSTAGGVRASGDGTLDDRDVPAGVHVRSCPSTRSGHRPGVGAGLGSSVPVPVTAPLVIDIDSTICEVAGSPSKAPGSATRKVLGYHPILATRADTGEVLHARMRKGSANTQRGARRFIDELVARVRRAGATGKITVRVDAGFWSNDTIATLNRLDVRYTMAVRSRTTGSRRRSPASTTMPGSTSTTPPTAKPKSPSAPTPPAPGRRAVTRRLIVRRTRLTDTAQQRLWPDWRHHAFLTDLDGNAVEVDRFHRHHAVVELAIRDLKTAPGSTMSRPATSTPTRPGCNAPCSLTT